MATTTLEHVARLAEALSLEDQKSLIEQLSRKLQWAPSETLAEGSAKQAAPQDLYGIWRDHFPADADIDSILHEARHAWEAEWPEIFQE